MRGYLPNKLFLVEPWQDDEYLSKRMRSSENELENELESEPTEVIEVIEKCCKFDNEINLISEAYHLGYGGPRNLLDHFSNLTDIETPMKNSVLHIAAGNGNDAIVTLLIERAPRLLFTYNDNHDSVLHVAARDGQISTIKKLLEGYTDFKRLDIKRAWSNFYDLDRRPGYYDDYGEKSNMHDLLVFVQLNNHQGNTMFHEAMLCDKRSIGGDMIFQVCELFKTEDLVKDSLSNCCYEYAMNNVNYDNKTALYLAVENGNTDAVHMILEKSRSECWPWGLSPLVGAIMMHNQEMLRIMLKRRHNWIHSKDKHKRLPLHYAASIGYLEGVDLLLELCKCCTIQRDKYGYFPIHLASHGGHVEVVKKLLEYCPNPTEMLDASHGRNILHMASNNGKHEVVRYILQSDQIRKLDKKHKMINQKDKKGNTPLHLAAKSFHPKTVFYLTWDKRVDYDLVNENNQTALDVLNEISQFTRLSTRQQLTRSALNSAGVKTTFKRAVHNKLGRNVENSQQSKKSDESGSKPNESGSKPNESDKTVSNTPQYFFLAGSDVQYKDRVETLILVSTLIITASVAACFAVPGEANGRAYNLYHTMFHFFTFFITISLFSSISATIILFWATLGLSQLVTSSLKIVMPLLGIALISLTLAFMAGFYTVISPLNWLANLFLVVAVTFVVLVILLYINLFLPSASTRKPMRYISYYPFLFLAWLAE
ncbi:protein ACCELERATED CELL DEATH 6-like [Vicia villosa]|uniref:protein ACCELERATED CELL DEATH 6-like n=1 Tax=Vicia villosa TaxID=3911 RepID=UPI00273B7917|nr:protein ACCELERATED CELL DEATH 6-like [Vicia villosa]